MTNENDLVEDIIGWYNEQKEQGLYYATQVESDKPEAPTAIKAIDALKMYIEECIADSEADKAMRQMEWIPDEELEEMGDEI